MSGYKVHGAAARISAMTVASILLVSACTGSEQDTGGQETLDLPYDYSLFKPENDPRWCRLLPDLIPPTGFLDENVEVETGGPNNGCSAGQNTPGIFRGVDAKVYGQWDEFGDSAPDLFEELTSATVAIPVEGIGEEAALIPPGSDVPIGTIFRNEVALLVLEGNLILSFEARSGMNIGGPDFRLEDLTTAAATAIGTAENYLAELGAENHTLQVPPGDPAEGTTVLPDLCSELAVEGLSLAGDQADWADGSETMDRCHWQGGGADLWLSAEAVGPLDAAGLSGEAFASWWVSSLPAAEGEELAAGDSGYVRLIDPEADNRDDVEDGSVVDFAVRIGNIVLQGRYQDGTLDQVSTASVFAEQISAQTTALVAGA